MEIINRKIFLKEKRLLFIIFIIALALRLLAVFNLPIQFQTPAADAYDYDTIAKNLVTAKGYSLYAEKGLTSLRTPLYPLFLASIYLIFGHNYTAVRVIQSIMSALLCIIIYYIGRKIFDKKVGLLSSIILVFYQPYISYVFYGGPGFLYSENLFVFLYALFVLFLVTNFFVGLSMKGAVIVGIFMGLLALTRPFDALFPLFFIFLLAYRYPFKTIMKLILTILIVYLLTLSPWIFRNYLVHKELIPFSTMGGEALISTYNPYVRGSGLGNLGQLFTKEELKQIENMPELKQDRFYRDLAIKYMFKNYKRIMFLLPKKLLCLWDLFQTHYDNGMKRLYNIWYSIIFMFSLFGIIKTIRSGLNINTLLLLLLFAYISFIVLIFGGDPRFRYPMEPYLIIFASFGIFAIWNKFRNKFLSLSMICFIFGINLLFYLKSELVLNWVRVPLRHFGM